MTLDEGITYEGRPFYIPDCPRWEFPPFLARLGYRAGAEIGVHQGKFTELFCQAGLMMFAIDPWMPFLGQGRVHRSKEEHERSYWKAHEILAPYDCVVYRETSMEAVKRFRDGSLDFVYIDGDHSLPHIVNDIWWWSHKVRKGGVVAGHDYFNTRPDARNVVCHGELAVNACAAALGIEKFWAFGGTGHRRRGGDGNSPGWFWFKP